MANSFLDLPAPAGNASGAEVDVSALGATKTIIVRGNGTAFEPYVLIEYSNDNAFQIWTPLVQFTKPGVQTVNVAARHLRATVKNYTQGGAPVVSVGASDQTASFAELVAPAGNGAGAAVDTSALPGFKTVQISGAFKGVCNIEASTDGGTSYATIASFSRSGSWSGIIYADRMRISRSGILARESNPGLPVCDVGAVEAGGGGGDGAYPDITDDPGVLVTIGQDTDTGDPSADVEIGASGGSGNTQLNVRSKNNGADANIMQVSDTVAGVAMKCHTETFGGGGAYLAKTQVNNLELSQMIRFDTVGAPAVGTGAPTYNNMAIDAAIVQELSPTANCAITGWAKPAEWGAAGNMMVHFLNVTAFQITLRHLNGGSLAANQQVLPGAADVIIPAFGAFTLLYSSFFGQWQMLSVSK